MAHTTIEIPFRMTEAELKIDPATLMEKRMWQDTIAWLHDNATTEELIRILTSAIVLYHNNRHCTIGEALDTAVIWERG